jgi:hypothetical protein
MQAGRGGRSAQSFTAPAGNDGLTSSTTTRLNIVRIHWNTAAS